MAFNIPHNPRDEEIDMAPMIDMVFLLLVFFMVASHLQSEEYIRIEDIPRAESATMPDDRSDRVIVSLLDHPETGEVSIHLGHAVVDEETLRETMVERNERFLERSTGDERLKLFLRAPSGMEHGEVRRIMRIAAEAGILDIIFATYERRVD